MNHFEYRDGVMHAEEVSLVEIADEVGTPFYCYSTATLTRHYVVFKAAFPQSTLIAYSTKANGNIAVLKTLAQLGAGADVVSGGELKKALAAGIPASRIVFSGVGKTKPEMRAALEAGIYQFNVEGEPELEALNEVALSMGTVAPIALRVNPDVDAGTHELTLDNNRAALVINGVRDRLKVLLVSGEPHQGERTWRNILKSDPSVDLIHFTILRPPEKQDGTPIRELSLIAFPIRELFDEKLDQFDLIIFDRYKQMNVLPPAYLENIARFVQNGGALLDAAGPSFGTPQSLYRTPLGAVLPAEPTGNILEQGYIPHVSAAGHRHPVTADLPGSPADPTKMPAWGRWFLDVEAQAKRGTAVLNGLGDRPLLVLDRVGEGRVAEMLSDQMWLWTRGFEGGGPQAELLRRIVYWLMKEPDLEENDLRAEVQSNRLVVTRQSLEPDDTPVQVTGPDGVPRPLSLAPQSGGRTTASMVITESGLYRVTDGKRTALAAAGALNPIELSDVRTTDSKVAADVGATNGGTFWIGSGSLPDIRRVGPDRTAAGRNWLGLRQNGDYVVTGVSETPLLPGLFALLLVLGAFLLAWRREGR
jgi:hypothetical protein